MKHENQYPVWKKIRLVPAADLNPTAYNPPGRTHGNNFTKLRKELNDIGIQMPILCTADGRIVDGHRRYYALMESGATSVPVLFLAENADPDEVWRSINTTSKPITGAEWTHAYNLGLPLSYVAPKYRTHLETVERIGGKEIVNEMAIRNLSARVMDMVNKTVRYVQREGDEEFLAICLRWMIEQKASYHVRRAMENEISPNLLELAILENRSLSMKNEYVLV